MNTWPYSPTIADRLHSGLKPAPNGCVEWMRSRSAWGYGRISRGAKGAGCAGTHRVAWELANGPIPVGMYVCHKCDNPPCCNVDHLFLGTLSDNTQDMLSKQRGRGHLPKGEGHPDARLTDEQVAELRRLAPTVGNYAALGRLFGITKQHARSLALGQKRAA